MSPTARTVNKVVWTIQVLLAVLFLFAGGSKLVMSDAALTPPPTPFSALFLRFIGVCELLGSLGLVLPMLLNIKPGLTPLAAAGLVVIMIGATVTTVIGMSLPMAILPCVAGLLAAYVAYARWPLLRRAESSSKAFT